MNEWPLQTLTTHFISNVFILYYCLFDIWLHYSLKPDTVKYQHYKQGKQYNILHPRLRLPSTRLSPSSYLPAVVFKVVLVPSLLQVAAGDGLQRLVGSVHAAPLITISTYSVWHTARDEPMCCVFAGLGGSSPWRCTPLYLLSDGIRFPINYYWADLLKCAEDAKHTNWSLGLQLTTILFSETNRWWIFFQ